MNQSHFLYELFCLQGPESDELAEASKLDDDVNFYQTVDPNVAKLFHINPDVKRPALVLLKKDAEKVTHHGQFLHLFLQLASPSCSWCDDGTSLYPFFVFIRSISYRWSV